MKQRSTRTAQISVRLAEATRRRLDRFADRSGRKRGAIAAEAIDHYLNWRIPQQRDLAHGLREADAGDLVEQAEMAAWMKKRMTRLKQKIKKDAGQVDSPRSRSVAIDRDLR